MAFEQVRSGRSLSRLQLLAAVALIGLCLFWFVERMERMTAMAEATALELTIRNARSGAMGALAGHLLRGDHEAIAGLHHANPVGTVIGEPSGYIGALRGARPENVRPGQWYFDEDNGWLVYHVVNGDYFGHEAGTQARVRMQLQVRFDDRDGDGAFDAGVDRASGVSVVLLDRPDWRF